MLAQRISSINSLSALCEKTGANIDELSKAIGMDHRIGPKFLKASVGFGGSCFQKDILNLVYLCQYYDLNEVAEYWHQVIKINDYQKNRFAQTIIEYFGGDLSGKKMLILGWAFKANTNDSRESASIFVTQKLFEAGAIIDIYDPKVSKINIIKDINLIWDYTLDQLSDRLSIKENNLLLDKYDAYVILTEYEDFKCLEIDPNLVFDGRNIFNQPLYSIGKG
jgi:UDPglucose 6-dehydrogenase